MLNMTFVCLKSFNFSHKVEPLPASHGDSKSSCEWYK
jgi:hypothetical protein